MPGPFYFSWVGGPSYPDFSLLTTANVWGGSLETQGDVWGGVFTTTGDLTVASQTVANVSDTLGLVVGTSYFIQGPGIPQNNDGTPSTTFTFDGSDSFQMSAAPFGVIDAGMPGATLTITADAPKTAIANLTRTDGLVQGEAYAISGAGIPPGTTATWNGASSLTLSQPATQTAARTSLTLTNANGRNTVALASTAGLIAGEVYSIFGPGIPQGFFTYAGSASVTLTSEATATKTAAFVSIQKGRSEDDGGAFDEATMLVEDEVIFAVEISHSEGECPSLALDVQNPRVGLLGPSRKLWCWLSWDSGSGIVPLFHGRIVGVPQRLNEQIVRLQFIAKPKDFDSQKATLAAGMRGLPYFDPLWLQDHLYDPDTVLETRSEHWHVDRTSLTVTTSDILIPEDGTLTVAETDHFYDALDVSYHQAPLRSVNVIATVTWQQAGSGDVDLTDQIVTAFRAAGSPFSSGGLIGSFTSDGLVSSWPKPRQAIGGGWSMGEDSFAVLATWASGGAYNISYIDQDDTAATLSPYLASQIPELSLAARFQSPWVTWFAQFPILPISFDFTVHWEAARDRSEQLMFVLSADTQAILTDPGTAQDETITVNSQFVAAPIDDGGALPIGDTRRASYFLTDRGDQSVQYLLLLARARLRARARAVEVKLAMPFDKGTGLSCRQGVQLFDPRLPGGQAIGKVIAYSLKVSGDGEAAAEVTIGCAIGYGNTLAAPAASNDNYADGYADDYTAAYSGLSIIDGELQYTALDPSSLDDDGVDLFTLDDTSALLSPVSVANGPTVQKAAIDAHAVVGTLIVAPDPIGALKRQPTEVTIDLVPVTGGAFESDFLVQTQKLMMPQGIDLEAA